MKVKTVTISSDDPPGYGCQISCYDNVIFIEGFNANSLLKSNGAIAGDIIMNVNSCVNNEVIKGSNFYDLSAFTNALGKLPRPVTFELVEPDCYTNGISSIVKSSIALNSLFTYIKSNYFEKKDTDYYINLINLYIDCELTNDFELLRVVYGELFKYFHDVHLIQEEKIKDNDYLKLQIKYELKAVLINYQNSSRSHFVNILEYIANKNNSITNITNISLQDMLSTKNLLFLYSSTVSASKENSAAIHTLFKQLLDDRNNIHNITTVLKYVPMFRTTVEYDLLINLTPIKKMFTTLCYHKLYVHYCNKNNNSTKFNDIKMFLLSLENPKVIPIMDSNKSDAEQSDISSREQCDAIFDYLIDNHCKQVVELSVNPNNRAMCTIHSYYFRHNSESYYGCTYSNWHDEIIRRTETVSNDVQIQDTIDNNASMSIAEVKTRNAVELYREFKNKTIQLLKNIKTRTIMLHLSQAENESLTATQQQQTTTTYESLSSTTSGDFESTCTDVASILKVEGFSLLINIPTITKLRHFVAKNICNIESSLKGNFDQLISLAKLEFGTDINERIDINDINTKLFSHLDPIIFLHLVYACLTESKIVVIASSNTAILSLGEYLRCILFTPFELTFGLYIPTFPSDSDITSYLDMPSSFFIGISSKVGVQKILKMQTNGILIIDMDSNSIISDIEVPLDDQVMELSHRIKMTMRQEYFTMDHILPIDSCDDVFTLLRDAVSDLFINPIIKCLNESCMKFIIDDTPLVIVNEEMFHDSYCSINYSETFSKKVLQSEYVAKYCKLTIN